MSAVEPKHGSTLDPVSQMETQISPAADPLDPQVTCNEKFKDGGGGGSRTRVRKHVVSGLYMRVRFWVLVPDVRKRLKTAGHQTRYVSPLNAGPPFRSQPV